MVDLARIGLARPAISSPISGVQFPSPLQDEPGNRQTRDDHDGKHTSFAARRTDALQHAHTPLRDASQLAVPLEQFAEPPKAAGISIEVRTEESAAGA